MKKRPLLSTPALLAGLAFSITAVQADWQPLFDGKSLDGWVQRNGEAEFAVEDGMVVGTSKTDTPNSFLCTEIDYDDFTLEFEFTVDEGLNSGVQFRSESRDDYQNGRVHGYQFEIDTAERAWTAGVYDEARRGWLYPLSYNEAARKLFKQDDWNKARIECVGNEVRTFLNGKPASHLFDYEAKSGFVALQVHSIGKDSSLEGTQVRWRNIRIDTDAPKPSKMSEIYIRNLNPNILSQAEKAQGWKLLFDGKSAKDWQGEDSENLPKSRWNVADGVLMVKGGPSESTKHVSLLSEKKSSAFALDAEFFLTEGANSGIKYLVAEYPAAQGNGTQNLGLEYQVLDNEKHPDAKKGHDGNRTAASLYDIMPAQMVVGGRDVPLSIGDWNHARIVMQSDGKVEHWLNGYKVLQYELGSEKLAKLIAESKFRDVEGFAKNESGRLLLQDHGDEVRFRSLKIREL